MLRSFNWWIDASIVIASITEVVFLFLGSLAFEGRRSVGHMGILTNGVAQILEADIFIILTIGTEKCPLKV